MKQFTYEISEHLGDLGTSAKNGWTRQVNRIRWNGRAPKIDIREWSADGARMGKGITLSEDEARVMVSALKEVCTHD